MQSDDENNAHKKPYNEVSQPVPDGSASPNNDEEKPTSTTTSWRSNVGQGMTAVSDLVNQNLVAFRYGTVATVTLLTVYGLAHTPLFFRYKSVNEIPAKFFTQRKRLTARLLKTVDNDQAGQPLQLYVQHLSPAGRFIWSKELFEWSRKAAPSAQGTRHKDWLKVEIAGVSAPPFYTASYSRGEWLKQLAQERTRVNLQFLGRRIVTTAQKKENVAPTKRALLPEVAPPQSESFIDEEEQVAVCHLYYRPSLFQFFSTDVADSLVRYGHASLESELFLPHPNTRVMDASTRLDDIRKDVQYLDRLSKLEYEAAQGSYGMWSDSNIRDQRRDIVEEVEFQATASVWQRLWRWMRG